MEESVDSYFPRIENVRDNYGNHWEIRLWNNIFTKTILRPGDVLDFTITAIDPEDLPLNYYCSVNREFSDENKFSITITESEIGVKSPITIGIKSSRAYRKVKGNNLDEWITFYYDIIPQKWKNYPKGNM